MRTLLIDCDTLVYRAAAANQTAIPWGDDEWTLTGNLPDASVMLEQEVEDLLRKLSADRAVMALSNYERPWRKDVMPTYKANRKNTVRPVLLKPLRDFVHEKYETVERQGLEGDDILGILATAPGKAKEYGERIIVTIDKDMQTIPGKLFRMNREDDGVVEISEREADHYHMLQALTGDRVDGYPGCPGVGPKRARAILDSCVQWAEVWPAVVAAYQKAGATEQDALNNARVARICRADDYDFKTKEVRLWEPK